MGLWFYPRGGSSQVARYLSSGLASAGWDVTLVAGSLGQPGDATHAATFFAGAGTGVAVHAVDYTAAVDAHRRGEDALAAPVPMHASYEDRGGVADRLLASVEPPLAERQAEAWARLLPGGFVDGSDVFHLHHLTPLHEAVWRRRPQAPVVAHLHGTELKFLETAAERAGESGQWRHGAFWARRLRDVAGRCRRLIVTSPADRDTAPSLLDIDPARIEWIPNGVDIALFRPRDLTSAQRLALLRRWLVEEPQGWDESGVPGTIRYADADLARLVDPATGELRPLLVYVGRFTAVKRIPLLLRAYTRARSRFASGAALVIWGGHPGELEGEHPRSVAARLGLDDVFFVGWRGHDELPLGLAAADLLVLPSVKESFGQTAIEAMACGVPVLATRSGGPPSFVNTEPGQPTGWLVEPDDEAELAGALVEAVNRPDERRRRGARSLAVARARFSWASLVPRFDAVYDELRTSPPPQASESEA